MTSEIRIKRTAGGDFSNADMHKMQLIFFVQNFPEKCLWKFGCWRVWLTVYKFCIHPCLPYTSNDPPTPANPNSTWRFLFRPRLKKDSRLVEKPGLPEVWQVDERKRSGEAQNPQLSEFLKHMAFRTATSFIPAGMAQLFFEKFPSWRFLLGLVLLY